LNQQPSRFYKTTVDEFNRLELQRDALPD